MSRFQSSRALNSDVLSGAVFVLALPMAWMQLDAKPLVLFLYVVAYVLCRWLGPAAWTLVPVAVVAGHTYPHSGSLLVSPADFFVAAMIAGSISRIDLGSVAAVDASRRRADRGWWIVLGGWWMAALLALPRGLLSLADADLSHQLDLYLTQLNAIYVFKGYLLGIGLVLAFAVDWRRDPDRVWHHLVDGMTLSAFVVSMCVIVERTAAYGVFDFSNQNRATGPCVSMHVGGQHIDAYWALALPFLVFARQHRPGLIRAACGAITQVVSVYAIFVTMSRAIVVVAFVIVAAAFLLRIAERKRRGNGRWFGVLTSLAMLLLLAAMWTAGEALPNRFRGAGKDMGVRLDHWKGLSRLAAESPAILGTGLGTYPSEYRRMKKESPRLMRYRAAAGETPPGVGLAPGAVTYLEQRVDHTRSGPWNVWVEYSVADARGEDRVGDFDRNALPAMEAPGDSLPRLRIQVCEKTLLQSYRCVLAEPTSEQSFPNGGRTSGVRHQQLTIDATELNALRAGTLGCPATVSITAERAEVTLHSIEIVDAAGAAVIENGSFANGSRYWFFSSDDHLLWRAKNMWPHLRIEMGYVGVFAWFALFVFFGQRLWTHGRVFRRDEVLGETQRTTERQRVVTGMTLGLGWLAMAMFGTLVDTPWILQLLLLVIAATALDRSSEPVTAASP